MRGSWAAATLTVVVQAVIISLALQNLETMVEARAHCRHGSPKRKVQSTSIIVRHAVGLSASTLVLSAAAAPAPSSIGSQPGPASRARSLAIAHLVGILKLQLEFRQPALNAVLPT